MPKIFSNLNLNGPTPPRVQPVLGEWGPENLPTTNQKRRMRIWVGLVLLGMGAGYARLLAQQDQQQA